MQPFSRIISTRHLKDADSCHPSGRAGIWSRGSGAVPGVKRVKIKWQTWCHTWAGFLGGVCGRSTGRCESGSRAAPTPLPAAAGVLPAPEQQTRLQPAAEEGGKKEFQASYLGLMQSKWNKSQALALFVVPGADQGSAGRGVSGSVSGRSWLPACTRERGMA